MIGNLAHAWMMGAALDDHRQFLRHCWAHIYSEVMPILSTRFSTPEVAQARLNVCHHEWAKYCHLVEVLLRHMYDSLKDLLASLRSRLRRQLGDSEVTSDADINAWVQRQLHDEVIDLHDQAFGGLDKLFCLHYDALLPLRWFMEEHIPDALDYLKAPFRHLPTWEPFPHGDESHWLPEMPIWKNPTLEVPLVDFATCSIDFEAVEGAEFDLSDLVPASSSS